MFKHVKTLTKCLELTNKPVLDCTKSQKHLIILILPDTKGSYILTVRPQDSLLTIVSAWLGLVNESVEWWARVSTILS